MDATAAKAQLQTIQSELAVVQDKTKPLTLQLQAAMEQQAKLVATISAIMKSQHDTALAIIQNLK